MPSEAELELRRAHEKYAREQNPNAPVIATKPAIPVQKPIQTTEVRLTACPVCTAQIASDAHTCPRCGHVLRSRFLFFVAVVIVGLLVAGVIAGFVDSVLRHHP